MITELLMCGKIFWVMDYEIKISLMLHSTVKFK